MEWYWLPEYAPKFVAGIWLTLQLLGYSLFFGMLLAIPIGLVQVTGPRPLALLAKGFCTVIRGTPLLIQLWLIYYGLGSLFRFQILRRIWLPRALQNVFPTLAGEAILTLKATPLAATITIFEAYGVSSIVRQETYRIYEPLLLLAGIYLCLTGVLVIFFRYMENRIPKAKLT